MAEQTSILTRADEWLDELFQGWNLLSTTILLALLLYMVYPLVTAKDPDTHPMILSRQANISSVRKQGQSAVYRSNAVPHGLSLKTGLNVRLPGAPSYAGGSDGDIRDIWRQVVRDDAKSKILVSQGVEKVIEQDRHSISKGINLFGHYIQSKGATTVALYLPNSVELLTAVFAAAFYGFHPVLIPYDVPKDVIIKLVNLSNADFLVAAAGSLPTQDVRDKCQAVKEVMWVVEETSREVGWTDAAEGVSTWHETIEEQLDNGSADLPTNSADDRVKDIITITLDDNPAAGELVALTHNNIVAAVGAQISVLPSMHRMSSEDVFLPAGPLTSPYMLIEAFAALFSGASVVINSVAGPDVPLATVTRNIAPTVIAATSAQAFQLHDATKSKVSSATSSYALEAQKTALKAGVMPAPSFATKLASPVTADIGTNPGSLRLLYVFDETNTETPPISSVRLSELRAFTGARVIHALTTAKVAGSVAQTNLYDYRADDNRTAPGHFGIAPPCLELFVKDKGDYRTTDETARGELVARGPAVANGEADLGFYAEFRDDGCLSYLFQYSEKSQKQ